MYGKITVKQLKSRIISSYPFCFVDIMPSKGIWQLWAFVHIQPFQRIDSAIWKQWEHI